MNTFTAKKLSFKEIQMAKPIYILYFISSSLRIKAKLNYKITYGSHYNIIQSICHRNLLILRN